MRSSRNETYTNIESVGHTFVKDVKKRVKKTSKRGKHLQDDRKT